MTGSVIRKTPKELHEQRARLIASTGLSEEVLRERGEAFQLYPEHQAAWETVQSIDYLLDGAVAPESEATDEPGEARRQALCGALRIHSEAPWHAIIAQAANNRLTLTEDEQHIRRVNDEVEKLRTEVAHLKRSIRRSREQVDGYDIALAVEKASAARVRALHERRVDAGGEGYCCLCFDHGDISWPCRTISAITEG